MDDLQHDGRQHDGRQHDDLLPEGRQYDGGQHGGRGARPVVGGLGSTRPPAPESAAGGAVPRRGLTGRERQVLRLTGRGLPPRVVAERLGVPQLAVAQDLSAARRTYGVRSSVAAVDVARRSGEID